MTTTLSSRIEAVTVYRQGALVHRIARLEADGPWPEHLVLRGLPLCLDERSLRVQVRSADEGTGVALPVATDLKIGLETGGSDEESLPAHDEELRAARLEERRRGEALGLLESELKRILSLAAAPRPAPEEGKEPRPSPVEGRLSLLVFREREALRLHDEIAEAREALRLALQARQDLEMKYAQQSTARQARAEELRRTVEIGLRSADTSAATPKGAIEIALSYLVPGAHWSPAYALQLDPSLKRGALSVRASVRQRTGEDWKNVALTLSTAEALGWTELPELKAIRIGRRQSPPVRLGWKPAPEGAEALYSDHDVGFPLAPQGSSGGSSSTPLPGSMRAMAVGGAVEPEANDYPSAEPPEEEWDKEDEWEESAELEADYLMDDEEEGAPMMERAMAPPPVSAAMPPPAPPMPSPKAARRMQKAGISFGRSSSDDARSRKKRAAPRRGGGGREEAAQGLAEEELGLTASADLLQYGSLRLEGPTSSRRGKLVPLSHSEITLQLVQELKLSVSVNPLPILERALHQARRVANEALPPGHVLPHTEGGFDYAYAAERPVDVPSDGALHTLSLLQAEGDAAPTFICVPRESTDVFRQVTFKNPLDAPLLDGPVDVQIGDDYLLTSRARNTPPRGELELGLGVEQAIKVARNVRFEEESTGLVISKLGLEHEIEVELTSHLPGDAAVEIRERLPVSIENDDDVEVEEVESSPAWEAFEQEPPVKGGRRWKITLKPAEKTVLKAAYRIRIPKGHELVGGNRREVS